MDSNLSRKKAINSTLRRRRLKEDALPSIWPDLPAHLSKVITPRPTMLASCESRLENSRRLIEKDEQDRIVKDTFS